MDRYRDRQIDIKIDLFFLESNPIFKNAKILKGLYPFFWLNIENFKIWAFYKTDLRNYVSQKNEEIT